VPFSLGWINTSLTKLLFLPIPLGQDKGSVQEFRNFAAFPSFKVNQRRSGSGGGGSAVLSLEQLAVVLGGEEQAGKVALRGASFRPVRWASR
jgi:hypothetical protein